jgi:hypothetical protein
MSSKPIEKTYMERRVFSGAQVKRGYRVSAIELVQCKKDDRPVELVKVKNQSEYSAGCPLHRGTCFGHMCGTPTGNILPPHSLSFRSGDIRTQYYIATTKAFEDRDGEYIEELKRTNYGKNGHLRSIMSTPVSGSGRLVCIPHTYRDPRVLFISPNLASKILFCLPMQYEDGVQGPTYIERELREGDLAMLERPPSLSKYNNQPFVVMLWNKECIGIHPKVFSYFHGDYDGDEAHVYALGSPESIAEASLWVHPLDKDLEFALDYVKKYCQDIYTTDGTEGDMEFVEHTTLSFDEILKGDKKLAIGDQTRNGAIYNRMFRERIQSGSGTATFLEDSIKGVKDIMRQQVSQGKIGDMSRIARISAMCVLRGKEGGTYIVCRKSKVLLNSETSPSTGSPSVRCIMSLCQASQQAALDAHRVGSKDTTGLDMISDLLKGRQECGINNKCHTFFIFESSVEDTVRSQMKPLWCCNIDGFTVCVSYDSSNVDGLLDSLRGAYSPIVLSLLPKGRAKKICRMALHVVYNYYNVQIEGDDIEDIVELMCFRVSSSKLPVTTRDGMLARGLGWMETLMACDYTKTPAMAGSVSAPYSATSATMCANFSLL